MRTVCSGRVQYTPRQRANATAILSQRLYSYEMQRTRRDNTSARTKFSEKPSTVAATAPHTLYIGIRMAFNINVTIATAQVICAMARDCLSRRKVLRTNPPPPRIAYAKPTHGTNAALGQYSTDVNT